MRVIADLHIHGVYSRAVSRNMSLPQIARYAEVKGLDVVGTGDFLHPEWFKQLRESLDEKHAGIFQLKTGLKTYFLLASEVSVRFQRDGQMKRIHHLILSPNFDVVVQLQDRLRKYGDLAGDGRPELDMSAAQLVEEVVSVSPQNLVIPAHIWTPWFSLFGAFSGFDRLDDCYQDMTKHIHALETGLSCYDEETEVLTLAGWKPFSLITYADQICTLNPGKNLIEFQLPINIVAGFYAGLMYALRTKRVNLLVTPNHRLLVSGCDFRKPPNFALREATLVVGKSKRIKKDGIWVGNDRPFFVLPAVEAPHGSRYYRGKRTVPARQFPIREWLKFFGFWLAEGWTTKGGPGCYDVCVSNSDVGLLSKIRNILERLGFSVTSSVNRSTGVLRVRDIQLYLYLKQFGACHEKFVPENIKVLSCDLLRLFLEYYLKGDGRIYGRNGKGLSASTTSVRLRDDLQEIALKTGVSAYYKLEHRASTQFKSSRPPFKTYKFNHDAWAVYFIRKNIHTILPSSVKKYLYDDCFIPFKGRIFCVSVPNQVIYVRRKGIPVWCGNSDPPMNWRISSLSKYALVSNSDAHSFWPHRLGREANVFEVSELTFEEIVSAIKSNNAQHFPFTIEVNPAYGKYHWTGHRKCGIVFSPDEAKKVNSICPVCRRRLTIGVDQRVAELADRPLGYKPPNTPGFVHLIPLPELIAKVLKIASPTNNAVWQRYYLLIKAFENEYNVMLNIPRGRLAAVVEEPLADAIIRARQEKIQIKPGYDGVYGDFNLEDKPPVNHSKKTILTDFF